MHTTYSRMNFNFSLMQALLIEQLTKEDQIVGMYCTSMILPTISTADRENQRRECYTRQEYMYIATGTVFTHLYTVAYRVSLESTVCACVFVCVFVGSCLATKVFISKLPGTGEGWVIIG